MRLPAPRWTLLVAALAALATTLVGLPAVSVPAASAAPGLTWTSCSSPSLAYAGLQCASLAVPLDRADPGGPTVTLALSRRQHTSSTYRGAVLVNPGGPGGAGRALAGLGELVPGGVGEEYDWIGFDPRGVGGSVPALRCSTAQFGFDRPPYVPRAAAHYSWWLARGRAVSASCADTAAERALLPHMTSLDTVADMESIRQALGLEEISYYGYSYGTYLGQLYAQRHPARVGRFVLDGVVDPTRVWYGANLDQDRAFQANLEAFWRYVARNDRAFHLGTRWRAIARGHARLLRQLDRRPAAGGRIGPAELTDVLTDAGYSVFTWPDIADAYSLLKRGRRGGPVLTLYGQARASQAAGYGVYNAVECTDAPWPTWSRVRADATALHRRAPFLTWSNTWFNGPCLSWRAPRQARPQVSGSGVGAKILLVSETGDAATPYAGALRVRALFPSASLVAGVGGRSHALSLSGMGCVDDTIAAYLRSGTVPARQGGTRADRYCPGFAPPPPWAQGGVARGTGGSTDRMPAALRRTLADAQRVR